MPPNENNGGDREGLGNPSSPSFFRGTDSHIKREGQIPSGSILSRINSSGKPEKPWNIRNLSPDAIERIGEP